MGSKALYLVSYGVFVVCSGRSQKNGQIANTVFQVASKPPTLSVSINKKNLTHELIAESGVFTVSILEKETPLSLIGLFGFKSGREIDKLGEVEYESGQTGAPLVLDHSLAHLEVEVGDSMDCGTHTLYKGELVFSRMLREGEPLTYAYYHHVKKGKEPETAPLYQQPEHGVLREQKEDLQKYQCQVCGYIYDPKEDHSKSGIPMGTPFVELPEDWQCPICGAQKTAFERLD